MIALGFVAPLAVALIAALALASPAKPVTGLKYPDLGMAPLADLQIDKPSDGRTLLRFSATIVNIGQGPFELFATRTSGSSFAVAQRVYGSDGVASLATPGVQLSWGGDGHNHFHVNNLESYELRRLDNGVKVGTAAKAGFCFYDTTFFRTLPGSPASSVYHPGTACAHDNPTANEVTMGVSVGWADTYGFWLVDQYIDISNVSDGKYRLWAKADPSSWFAELNDTNNETWVDIALTTHRKQGTRIRIIKYGPSA
jgi:hypothetical protein